MTTLFETEHPHLAGGIAKIQVSDPLGRGEYLEYLVVVQGSRPVDPTYLENTVRSLTQKFFREKFGNANERLDLRKVGTTDRDFPNDSSWQVQVWPWANT